MFPTLVFNFSVDLACFKVFKIAFRKQRDAWTLLNKKKRVGKKDLCEWTSKAFQVALMPKNIKVGFRKSGIWPLDQGATRESMKPLVGFEQEEGGGSNKRRFGASQQWFYAWCMLRKSKKNWTG